MEMNQSIDSDLISFRATVQSDLVSVLSMEQNSENRPFIRQWTPEQHLAAIADRNVAHLVISTPDCGLIGYFILIGLENADRSIEFKRIVIDTKGKGFGRKVVAFVKKLVFDEYNFHRLWLEVVEHNDRAFSLYHSEGFTEEGVHRESLKQGDHFASLRVMSILEQEYRQNK
jgi:diamine N-acetyltransferase